jgi:hypothetical protein
MKLDDLIVFLFLLWCKYSSHHSSNDVTPLLITSNVHHQRTFDHQLIDELVKKEASLGTFWLFIKHTSINVSGEYNSIMRNKHLS